MGAALLLISFLSLLLLFIEGVGSAGIISGIVGVDNENDRTFRFFVDLILISSISFRCSRSHGKIVGDSGTATTTLEDVTIILFIALTPMDTIFFRRGRGRCFFPLLLFFVVVVGVGEEDGVVDAVEVEANAIGATVSSMMISLRFVPLMLLMPLLAIKKLRFSVPPVVRS